MLLWLSVMGCWYLSPGYHDSGKYLSVGRSLSLGVARGSVAPKKLYSLIATILPILNFSLTTFLEVRHNNTFCLISSSQMIFMLIHMCIAEIFCRYYHFMGLIFTDAHHHAHCTLYNCFYFTGLIFAISHAIFRKIREHY